MVRMDKGPALNGPKTLGRKGPAPSKSGSTLNMAANIKVIVRVRPLNEKEMVLNNRVVVDVVDDKMLVFDPKEETRPFFYQGVQQTNKCFLKRPNKELKFVFDHVCDQNSSNKDVFEMTTKEMISSLMEGYNCSVFAYGATGAGKTYTMIGNIEHPGITYLTMEHLFFVINSFQKDREFDIAVSYIEVYNENVYDLLKPSSTPLQLREDSKYGVMVPGITLSSIKTARELLNMLENGNKNRTQHPTDANAESSRSHAVFEVYVKMRNKTSSQFRLVKLSMIDLAGSERASATGCVGDRFKEGANINKSLLSLGNCINKLADGSSYIPYRDSKLTRLLKDSLGGNCKTVMIANVSSSSISYEDTYNTLKYAARANKIQLSIKKNIMDGNIRVSEYVKMNEELKKKVKELETKLTMSSATRESEYVKVNEDLKKKIKELEAKLTLSCVKRDSDPAKENVKQEWRNCITNLENEHSSLESQLLNLMSCQRVLALRQLLKTRAFSHVVELAHRSSFEALEQISTEEIPRKERAAENYVKQSVNLDYKVFGAWARWEESRKNLHIKCQQALQECPDLNDFITTIHQQSELRQNSAKEDLSQKVKIMLINEINAFTEYTSYMPALLKKLYLTLKGYQKVPPALTEEYLEVMKKAKCAKSITWSENEDEMDAHYKFILTLDVTKPNIEYELPKKDVEDANKDDINVTIDIISDVDADIENQDPVKVLAKKRKATPMKQLNNETIIINDSCESINNTEQRNSAKKIRKELNFASDIENYCSIDPEELNSTFVLAGKFEAKKPIKTGEVIHRGLVDRTNIMPTKTTIFGDKAKILKPIVGKALPVRRPGPNGPIHPAPRSVGFGSSVPRDNTQQRNIQDSIGRGKINMNQKSVGYKAVKARDRYQSHPYSRPVSRK